MLNVLAAMSIQPKKGEKADYKFIQAKNMETGEDPMIFHDQLLFYGNKIRSKTFSLLCTTLLT